MSSHDKYDDNDDDIYCDDDDDYYDVDVDGDDNDDDEYDEYDDNAYAASVVAAADNDNEMVLLYCYVQTSKTKIPNHENNLEYCSLKFHLIGHMK